MNSPIITQRGQSICANCGAPFTPQPSAPGQRFHAPRCRIEWHTKRQRAARAALAELEHAQPGANEGNGNE